METGEQIVASAVGVVRNDAHLPFPHSADEDLLQEFVTRVSGALERSSEPGAWQLKALDDLAPAMRTYLVERGLMTPTFASLNGQGRTLAVCGTGEMSLEINGYSHLHMLACRTGDVLTELWVMLDGLDDVLEAEVTYAFDERRGYLMPRPADSGTGCRAYLMLHIPALMVMGRLPAIAMQLAAQGFTLLPLWQGAGAVFQVSNTTRLGIAELPTTEAVGAAARRIVEQEQAARKKLLRDNPVRARDYIGRALGTAQNAWNVSAAEGMSLISAIEVGVEMGIVEAPNMDLGAAFVLMRRLQPGHLAVETIASPQGGLDDPRIDTTRARILRETFAQARVRSRR